MISSSVKQTHKIAKDLAGEILKKKPVRGIVVGLAGELGSGKTTFVQGFAKALGVKTKVVSPTFVIMRHYPLFVTRYAHLYHIDCYRINKPKEILDLGWKEIIRNPQNIILIEWPEKIKKILPKKHFSINFKHINKNKRWIKIKKF
jgi:tRNA threonylcarbamoyladenosine biosynthesis protein TsaE